MNECPSSKVDPYIRLLVQGDFSNYLESFHTLIIRRFDPTTSFCVSVFIAIYLSAYRHPLCSQMRCWSRRSQLQWGTPEKLCLQLHKSQQQQQYQHLPQASVPNSMNDLWLCPARMMLSSGFSSRTTYEPPRLQVSTKMLINFKLRKASISRVLIRRVEEDVDDF